MLIVGTMIGAGFCSGQEIVAFFGSGISVAVAPLCGLCIFAVCVLFLQIGAKVNKKSFDKVNAEVLGKYHFVADFFLLANNTVVLSAMIAGVNSLCKPFMPVPVLGAAAAIACAAIAYRGAKGMLDCNFLLVPVIIVVLTVVCAGALRTGEMGASAGVFRFFVLPSCIVYVSMNMLLASTVLTTLGGLSRKQILWGSGIAALILTVLLFLLITALNSTGRTGADMPVLEIAAAGGKGLYAAVSLITGLSIFTTMLTAVGGLCAFLGERGGNRIVDCIVVVTAGVLLSFIGFARVVQLFYPLIGVLGLVYIVACIRFVRAKKQPFRSRMNGKAVKP